MIISRRLERGDYKANDFLFFGLSLNLISDAVIVPVYVEGIVFMKFGLEVSILMTPHGWTMSKVLLFIARSFFF